MRKLTEVKDYINENIALRNSGQPNLKDHGAVALYATLNNVLKHGTDVEDLTFYVGCLNQVAQNKENASDFTKGYGEAHRDVTEFLAAG